MALILRVFLLESRPAHVQELPLEMELRFTTIEASFDADVERAFREPASVVVKNRVKKARVKIQKPEPERTFDSDQRPRDVPLVVDDSFAKKLFPESLIPKPQSISHGVTMHREDLRDLNVSVDDSLHAQVAVHSMVTDDIASARARTGLPKPGVQWWTDALGSALNQFDGGTPAELGVKDGNVVYRRSYLKAAAAYGATGNPGFRVGAAPLQSETLARLDAPLELRTLAQAVETQAFLAATIEPLLMLTLEVNDRDGDHEVKILNSSGNTRFDQFVLHAVEFTNEQKRDDQDARAVWQIEGWFEAPETEADKVLAHLPNAVFVAPIVKLFTQTSTANARFRYRTRLIRSY
jgi:hypothetical protein